MASSVVLDLCAHHLPPSDLLRLPLAAGNFPILTPRHFTYFVSCQIYDAGIFIDISPLVFSVSPPPLNEIYFHMKRCLTENKAPAGKKSNTFFLFFILYNFIATTERFLFLFFFTFKNCSCEIFRQIPFSFFSLSSDSFCEVQRS